MGFEAGNYNRATKQGFADKCVPKLEFGNEKNEEKKPKDRSNSRLNTDVLMDTTHIDRGLLRVGVRDDWLKSS